MSTWSEVGLESVEVPKCSLERTMCGNVPAFGTAARQTSLRTLATEEANMRKLERMVEKQRHLLSKLRTQLAPAAHCVPPDLLSRIFLLAMPDSFYFPNDMKKPYSVLSVCRYWRSTALATSRLWSRFFVGSQLGVIFSSIPMKTISSHFDKWIERSGKANLDVSNNCHTDFWNILVSRASQWSSACISTDPQGFVDLLTISNDLTSLTQLDLEVDFDEYWSYKLPSTPAFFLPKLDSLTIHSYCVKLIQATSISSLCMTYAEDDDLALAYAARSFPSLTRLELIPNVRAQGSAQKPSYMFPKVIDFKWSAGYETSTTLDSTVLLAMPSLAKVTLITDDRIWFHPLQGSIIPTVVSLSLGHICNFPERNFILDVCLTFPNIQELDVSSQGGKWLEALLPPKPPNVKSPYVLPRLKKLHLRRSYMSHLTLLNFAEFRCVPEPKGGTEPEDLPKIAHCRLSLTECHDFCARKLDMKDADFELVSSLTKNLMLDLSFD